MMEFRKLGSTGLKVSVVGLGTLGFARVGLFNKGEEGVKEISYIVNRALDLGINFVDTAFAYGNGVAETGVGAVVKARRKDCIVLSRSHVWQTSEKPEDTASSIDNSLKRLNMEAIDVFEVHDVTKPESYKMVRGKGIYDVVKKAKKDGKLRFIGFSTHGSAEMMKEMINSGDVDVLTVAYNLTGHRRMLADGDDIRKTEEEILPLCKEKGIGITIMKPFGGGVMTQPAPDGTKLTPLKLLKFVVQNPYVNSVTPGVNYTYQIEELVKAGDPAYRLSDKEISELRETALKWGKDFCRQCGYCLPCENNIKIPEMMNILRYAQNKDPRVQKHVREHYAKMEVKADACTECKKCEERCPYGLPISAKMKELAAAVK